MSQRPGGGSRDRAAGAGAGLEQELEKKRRVIAEVVEENLEMDDAEDGGRGLRLPLGTAIHGPVTVQLTGGA